MTTKHPCPTCGSKDNLVKFDNGTEWCFTTDCEYNRTNGHDLIHLTPINISTRGLGAETLARYNAGIGPDLNLWFPYYKDGKVVGYKVRAKGEKKFWFIGRAKDATLFGLQAARGDRRVILTEGELDALAAHQMTGYPALSVRGASSAECDVKANLEFLESFDSVYVCFDMDAPGQKAADEVMSLLRPGKGLRVSLPEGFKDACDMLKEKKGGLFKDCIFSARPIHVEGIIAPTTLVTKAMALFTNEVAKRGVSTGYKCLDHLLGGLRPGEVTTLVGGTGVGKTAVARQLAVNLVSQGESVFYIPLEMLSEVVVLQMSEMVLKANVLVDNNHPASVVEETIVELSEKIKFFDHFGTIDPIKLLNTVEYVSRTQGTKFVVLDHISAVVNGQDDERRAIDQTIAGLKELSLRLGLHIIVVSHMSRSSDDKDDNTPTLNKIRHSQGLAQYSDQVLGLKRHRATNVIEIETLKVSRLWGQYGKAKLTWNNHHFEENEEHPNALLPGNEPDYLPSHGGSDVVPVLPETPIGGVEEEVTYDDIFDTKLYTEVNDDVTTTRGVGDGGSSVPLSLDSDSDRLASRPVGLMKFGLSLEKGWYIETG